MPEPKHDHQILREFELANSRSNCSAYDFIRKSPGQIGVSLQLEIIAVAVELLLRSGQQPEFAEITKQFPYLGKDLNSTLADSVDEFVREHCPVTSAVGPLPKQVDGYLIEEEIGRGGMGVVYRANQLSLDRTVALKVLFFSREEILQEARSLASLVHPNICGVYDIGVIAGLPLMAMRYVHGQRLTEFIQSAAPVPINTCVDIICKLTMAMQEAHEIGVVHLDIKPSNILLTKTLEPMLTDFGLARRSDDSRSFLRGSPSFLPPEQISTAPIANRKRCDIYSLGAVLFELLTGRRAFAGSVEHVLEQIKMDPPRRPSDYRSDINSTLESACLRALCKDPSDRFHSMREFHDALRGSLSSKRQRIRHQRIRPEQPMASKSETRSTK